CRSHWQLHDLGPTGRATAPYEAQAHCGFMDSVRTPDMRGWASVAFYKSNGALGGVVPSPGDMTHGYLGAVGARTLDRRLAAMRTEAVRHRSPRARNFKARVRFRQGGGLEQFARPNGNAPQSSNIVGPGCPTSCAAHRPSADIGDRDCHCDHR